MSTQYKVVHAVALVLASGLAWADVPVTNANFSTPAIDCSLGYVYETASNNCDDSVGPGQPFPHEDLNAIAGIGWHFALAGDGLTRAGTAFNPPTFPSSFTQAAFLQGSGSSVSQQLFNSFATNWTVSFYLGSRYATGSNDGKQTVEVSLDNHVVGTYILTSNTPFTLETTAPFVLAAGTHTLEFLGTAGGDHTAFLSDVSVGVPEPVSIALLAANFMGILFFRFRHRNS